ncbi:MAG: phage integrase N-terminal SAM-like domain-containing protein [Pirellulaceae bacterium]|nr:phage integrase N-terminal SAM-like domain-containing protein [Pirellulaceae bacterium]
MRNRSPRTVACYVRHVANFAKHFGRSPEELGPEQVRLYQLHLLEQKASWSAFNQCICALRFLYGSTASCAATTSTTGSTTIGPGCRSSAAWQCRWACVGCDAAARRRP